ncbi:MAG TPA: protein kinase [Pyrinomonadaceae bacterium]|jgi:ketosteroid isomerase-like protein
MNCPNCHEPLRDGAQFCTRCGARTAHEGAGAAAAESAPTAVREEAARSTGGDDAARAEPGAGDPMTGRVLDGKYEIVAPLGTGGMGAVYRARRVLIGDEVAVKVLHSRLTGDEKLVERFRREARAAAQLQHPNVVTIHDYGESRGPEGFAYIVMELVRGESLRALLKREGRLAPARAVSLMRDVCAGVGAAHRRGIVHRDVKPDNIIVTPADEDRPAESVKVVDFGIAKLRDMAHEGSTLTEAGTMVGTLFYMSPEQCKGEPLDSRADVYSLGAMLHEMLAGAPPFTASSMTSLVIKHVSEPPPPLPADLQIPQALRAAVARALAKEPDARQSDASEFAREIQAALASPAAAAPQAGAAPPQAAEPFFPATARPVTVTPARPAAQGEVTFVPPAAQQQQQQHWPPPAQYAPAPQRQPPPQQPPHAHAAPVRSSRRGYVIGLLAVLFVGLGGLSVLAFFYYLSQRDKPAAANARPTPAPRANANAGASPTPNPLGEAGQRLEQKVVAGSLVAPSELSGLTAAQLRLLRNTVYARYGRVFREDDLKQHFASRPWYKPRDGYSDRLLTTSDRANADLFKAFEDNGGRPPVAEAGEVSREVAEAVAAWAASTRERDLGAHMGHYADTLETYYKKQNVPASQVRADRQSAFVRYDQMDVQIGAVEVKPDPTGLRATVAFDKTWEFDSPDKNSRGSVRQQLMLVRAGGRWLINGEKDLQVYYSDSEDY